MGRNSIHFLEAPAHFDQAAHAEWLLQCAASFEVVIVRLSYQFYSDAEIQALNRQFLQHDYPTDIITFGYSEGKSIEADIAIGLETVQSNAEQFQVAPATELQRVLAHGLLHLIGFDDKTPEKQIIMKEKENFCLHLRPEKIMDVSRGTQV